MSAGILWGIGWIMLFISIAVISKDYKVREVRRTEIPILQPTSSTMYLELLNLNLYREENYYDHLRFESALYPKVVVFSTPVRRHQSRAGYRPGQHPYRE